MSSTDAMREGINNSEASEIYEGWLVSGFSQAAYMARDILRHGVVLPETRQRVRNERKGIAIEKLGEPYVTTFEYDNVDGCLRAEDGEMFVPIFTRGYEQVLEDFKNDSRLSFLVERHKADIDHAIFLQNISSDPNVPVGTTVIINSPSPNPNQLGVPVGLIEEYNYRPLERLAMQWIATKTETGIKLQSSNLFNAEPYHLAEATSVVAGQPVEVSDRETMPGQRTVFLSQLDIDVAHQLQMEFDKIHERENGIKTFHGLESDQHSGEDVTWLVESVEFNQSLMASEAIIEQVAQSLIIGEFLVDRNYMEQLLMMKKIDGSYELDGSARQSVIRVVNSLKSESADLYTALNIAQIGADAILWATLRNLYDGKIINIVDNVSEAVQNGVSSVEAHRQLGTADYECPGGRTSSSKELSIFDMNADQLASAFMRRTFITNCPLCEEKNVIATQENGTITCGTCKGCVEICTGAVINKSRKQNRVMSNSGKLATKTSGIVDWFISEWKSYKESNISKKSKTKKYEKITV